MSRRTNLKNCWCRATPLFLVMVLMGLLVCGQTITPSPYWKDEIVCPNEPFRVVGTSASDPDWVKLTILLAPYDANIVYFQDSQAYTFHYHFATEVLDPFIGMSPSEYDQVTLYEQGQQAILGAVIMPATGGYPPPPALPEYGIQFVRQDPYSREEIANMFNVVKASIIAEAGVQAFYFPSYEQLATAQANRDWFESQGIPISSTARWSEGNALYSEGWALGELKFFGGEQIEAAYLAGDLLPGDILLTDGVPAEIPFVAGIISLAPSTPSSHVAILAQTYGVPFVFLALTEDADKAQQLLGHRIAFTAYDDGFDGYNVKLIDVEGVLTEEQIAEIRALKTLPPLDISPMVSYGAYSAAADGLVPADIQYFGGKAANYGMLRQAIPDNSPEAIALSFDLWNEFLGQSIVPRDSVTIEPNSFELFWADRDPEQGSNHADFKLNDEGEYIGLYDRDGTTLIDGLAFGLQTNDVSYGRSIDGGDTWQFFAGGSATPGYENSPGISSGSTLVINEFMAENDLFIPDDFGEYDDWFELYNASGATIDLGGMYLTDDADDPTGWMIPPAVTGSTLRQEIANRLSGYTYPPSDMAALSEDLSAIRSLFKNTYITSFTAAQIQAIETVLQNNFDVNEKIRFRSSTNVEDSEEFTGAGLYDSFSGCLADDLDGDDDGPCICDPNKANERGVFRAIRKVFASFYNDNAFLERLRHDVNEAEVGMALLVHHSFPDEIELANGVATLEKGSGSSRNIMLVTQLGATSVANPEPGSIPEEVSIYVSSSGSIYPTLVCSSSLVPLGAKVMEWEDDYTELSQLLVDAADEFEPVTGKTQYVLDFEYKKVAPGGAALPAGGLVVKQIRQIPQPDTTPSITPFLINEPVQYCTFQGEFGDVFANHRLKSRWMLETKNMWLTPENLDESFYANAYIEYAADGRIRTLEAKLPLLPFAFHSFDGEDAVDGWTLHHLANPRVYSLYTYNVPTQVSPTASPLVTLRDFYDWSPILCSEYTRAVPSESGATTTDQIRLWEGPRFDVILQERTFDGPNGVSISTSFYIELVFAGTGALSHFVETVIEGYTSEPIVLHGYYSQTYGPEHHNWCEDFLFEPRLEPGISQHILDELRVQDIRLIYVFDNCGGPSITTYRFEDEPFYPGDLDDDGDVDLTDFALFASRWLDTVCDECGGADLTGDGQVVPDDLREFADNWLTGIE